MTIRTRKTTSALALVLPNPPLPPPSASRTSLGRRSSYSSMSSIHSIPHTPSACGTPLSFKFDSSINGGGRRTRSSTDSWASSTQDADDMEWEWTKDQVALLSKRLDSLPQNILTPFSGSVPPSNLLDRLARQIVNSQNPPEWPHNVRATRQKLLEIARLRGSGNAGGDSNMSLSLSIPEEEKENEEEEKEETIGKAAGRRRVGGEGESGSKKSGAKTRKPLYRQSSMDFLNEVASGGRGRGFGGNETLTKLSTRLQRTTTRLTRSHPYARPQSSVARSPSPSPFHRQRRMSALSTSSSGNSSRSGSMPPPPAASTVSATATTSTAAVTNPLPLATRKLRPRPDKKKEPKELVPITEEKKKLKLKRPPSHSAVALKMRGMNISSPPPSAVDPPSAAAEMDVCPLSSDEEEKARSVVAKKAKRTRTRTRSGGSTTATDVAEKKSIKSPPTSPRRSNRRAISSNPLGVPTPTSPSQPVPELVTSPRLRPRATTGGMRHKDKEVFGNLLPPSPPPPVPPPPAVAAPPPIPEAITSPRTRARAATVGVRHKDKVEVFGELLPPAPAVPQPTATGTGTELPRPESPPKTLRRVNKTHFPLRPGRKISFGSLGNDGAGGEASTTAGKGEGLQEPFEMTT